MKVFEYERDVPCRATTIASASTAHDDPNRITIRDNEWREFVALVQKMDAEHQRLRRPH